MSDSIPLAIPYLGGNELKYVQECVETNTVAAAGRFIPLFERMVADHAGAPHAVAVVNGTAALHVAMRVIGVGPGQEVLCPDFTFVAPVNAVLYCGAVPVLLDVDRETGTLSPAALEAFLKTECERREGRTVNRRTGRQVSAVLPVHLYGHPADLDPIRETAAAWGLQVVEDAAECLGAEYKGSRMGSRSEIACYSFNGNKVITAGCGGMLVTHRSDWMKRARHLVSQARIHPADYIHDEVGFNYRLPNVNAAIGCAQMERLDRHLEAKRHIADSYQSMLAGLPGLSLMKEQPWARSSYWLNTVLIDAPSYGRSAAETAELLRSEGIEARRVWAPLHRQEPYKDCPFYGAPGAEWLYDRGVNLPSSVGLDDAHLSRVVGVLRRAPKS